MAGKSAKNRGLGRGLDALFADQASVSEDKEIRGNAEIDENSVVYIGINEIKPNHSQPRKTFNEDKIAELSESILEHGIIQPLVVRRIGENFEIVAGERRWRAARKASFDKVPCIVREFTDEENMLVAIIENMQREDLNPIEEAEGLNQMIKTYGLTQDQVSKSVSKSRPYITNSLRLLKLPESIKNYVSEGKMTTGHARALISVKSETLQLQICKKIIDEGISVRDVEKLVTGEGKPPKRKLKKIKNANTVHAERELKDVLGTRVSINQKGKKGTIEIEYYSDGELNRLIDMLKSID